MLKVRLSKKVSNKLKLQRYKLVGKRMVIAYLVKGVTLQASGLCIKHRKRKTKYETIELRVFYRKTYYDIVLSVKNTKSINYLVHTV